MIDSLVNSPSPSDNVFWLQVTEYAIESGLNHEKNLYAQNRSSQDLPSQGSKMVLTAQALPVCPCSSHGLSAFPLCFLIGVIWSLLSWTPCSHRSPWGGRKEGTFLPNCLFVRKEAPLAEAPWRHTPLSHYGQGESGVD